MCMCKNIFLYFTKILLSYELQRYQLIQKGRQPISSFLKLPVV